MKKLLAIATFAFAANFANAQQIALAPEVISPAGDYYENQTFGITLSSTIGQMLFETEESNQIILTQGFQQPMLPNDPTDVQTISTMGIDMQVYPNPFNSEFYTVINLDKNEKLNFTITDITGKTVNFNEQVSHPMGKATYTFNTSGLAQGLYHLTVRSESGNFAKTVKISKID